MAIKDHNYDLLLIFVNMLERREKITHEEAVDYREYARELAYGDEHKNGG